MDSVIKAYAPAMVVIGVSSLVCASHAATLVDQFHGKTSASDDRSLQTPVKKPTKHRNSPSSVMILEEEVEQEAEEEEDVKVVGEVKVVHVVPPQKEDEINMCLPASWICSF